MPGQDPEDEGDRADRNAEQAHAGPAGLRVDEGRDDRAASTADGVEGHVTGGEAAARFGPHAVDQALIGVAVFS
jgi:hypothetical protein